MRSRTKDSYDAIKQALHLRVFIIASIKKHLPWSAKIWLPRSCHIITFNLVRYRVYTIFRFHFIARFLIHTIFSFHIAFPQFFALSWFSTKTITFIWHLKTVKSTKTMEFTLYDNFSLYDNCLLYLAEQLRMAFITSKRFAFWFKLWYAYRSCIWSFFRKTINLPQAYGTGERHGHSPVCSNTSEQATTLCAYNWINWRKSKQTAFFPKIHENTWGWRILTMIFLQQVVYSEVLHDEDCLNFLMIEQHSVDVD